MQKTVLVAAKPSLGVALIAATITLAANVHRVGRRASIAAMMAVAAVAMFLVDPVGASAQAAGGQTYGLGQQGSPVAADYTSSAIGFSSSLSPLLTAILPTLVVILAIWRGPWLLKHLVNGFTRS